MVLALDSKAVELLIWLAANTLAHQNGYRVQHHGPFGEDGTQQFTLIPDAAADARPRKELRILRGGIWHFQLPLGSLNGVLMDPAAVQAQLYIGPAVTVDGAPGLTVVLYQHQLA